MNSRPAPHLPVPRLAFAALAALLATPSPAEVPLPQLERLRSSPVLRELRPNPTRPNPGSVAAETLAQFHAPQGFQVDLVAAEPEVRQPVAFAWDDRGRIWVAESHSYPTKRPDGEGLDRLVILADADGDGSFETRKVFLEKLNLVTGLELGHGGVWVGAAPDLLFIPDRDRDDVPDAAPEVLLDGFGYQDTHECLNSFLWGPDGWLYGIQGVFNLAHIGRPGAADADRTELRAGVWRFHPIRREFEVFAHGGSNPWGLDFDERGQIFMTHCRSYWGRGGTTHVLQGGQFWNQANANYAPYILAQPPEGFPDYRNYLLASARYDHGAGGAGAPGTDAIYGGHSHVGTMIYLGDNWPEEFRGRLFTHNLHGHQINQQVNRPWGSGFDTVHAGRDHLFCADPKYVALDLQYGPDGAVYINDWYDQQHCHNPNAERWERGNGRLYRMAWSATWKPSRTPDLGALPDAELVALHRHRNEWHVRTARRVLHERAAAGRITAETRPALERLFGESLDPALRLRALWTLHAVGGFSPTVAARAFADPEPYVRGWAVQLDADDRQLDAAKAETFLHLARTDPSPVVRRHLASALHRVPDALAWDLAEALARHGEDKEDRNIPYLLWHGLAPRLGAGLDRAFAIAATTPLTQLADWIHWYAATLEGDALNRAVAALAGLAPADQHRRLAGLWLAMEPRANLPQPATWPAIAASLRDTTEPRVRRLVERLAAAFGDSTRFDTHRRVLAEAGADRAARQHAFAVLARAQDAASLPVFLQLLDDAAFRAPALNLVGRFDRPEVSAALIERFARFDPAERAAALNALTGRPAFALALLDAVASGRIPRDQVTAFHVRQLIGLKNPAIDTRVQAVWGRIQQTPAEKLALIDTLEKTFREAPLWAYDARAGREHYLKVCASCHVLGRDGTRVGPELSGAGKNGIRYFLENIIDPNAVVGTDFQLTTVDLKSGESISGLKISETASAITLRTTTAEQVIARKDIEEQSTSQLSLMPEGLLEALPARERIELLKYLVEN